MDLKKHWCVEGDTGRESSQFSTQALAEEKAKRQLSRKNSDQLFIYEAVSAVTTPVPEYAVVKL